MDLEGIFAQLQKEAAIAEEEVQLLTKTRAKRAKALAQAERKLQEALQKQQKLQAALDQTSNGIQAIIQATQKVLAETSAAKPLPYSLSPTKTTATMASTIGDAHATPSRDVVREPPITVTNVRSKPKVAHRSVIPTGSLDQPLTILSSSSPESIVPSLGAMLVKHDSFAHSGALRFSDVTKSVASSIPGTEPTSRTSSTLILASKPGKRANQTSANSALKRQRRTDRNEELFFEGGSPKQNYSMMRPTALSKHLTTGQFVDSRGQSLENRAVSIRRPGSKNWSNGVLLKFVPREANDEEWRWYKVRIEDSDEYKKFEVREFEISDLYLIPLRHDICAECETRRQSEDDDDGIYCTGCDVMFHYDCLNPALDPNEVEDCPWFCTRCKKEQEGLGHINIAS